MAGIDKTYIDSKYYPLFREWWIANYEKMIKQFGDYIWLYPFNFLDSSDVTPEYLKSNTDDLQAVNRVNEIILWNTSESVDLWLIKHCDLQPYRNYLLSVYSLKWRGFKGCDWIPKIDKKQKYVNKNY